VNLNFEGGVIDTFYGAINALQAFVNLIHGTPLDAFRQCKDEKCGRRVRGYIDGFNWLKDE
jgi:hypothetical protein